MPAKYTVNLSQLEIRQLQEITSKVKKSNQAVAKGTLIAIALSRNEEERRMSYANKKTQLS